MIEKMVDDALKQSTPQINNFLDIMDPDNEDGLKDFDYLDDVLRTSFVHQIILGKEMLVDAQKPITPLPDFCDDEETMMTFELHANELASQITLNSYIDKKIASICEDNETTLAAMIVSMTADTELADVETEAALASNFHVASASGFVGDIDDYREDQYAAFVSSDFTPLSVGYEITDIPTGFCKMSVYETLEAA